MWFFCAQAANTPASHCGKGMVFAINAPQSGTTFNAFKASAISQGGNGALTAAGITGPTPAPAAVQPQGQQPQGQGPQGHIGYPQGSSDASYYSYQPRQGQYWQ